MLKSLLPEDVNVDITTSDIRLRPNLRNINTKKFNKKSFLNTNLGFTQSYLGPSSDIEGFVQLIPGSYISNRPINIT